MKELILPALLLGWTLHPLAGQSQPSPPAFPLAGDWQGDLQIKGEVHHLVLHLNTNAEGKMTALEDFPDENSYGWPAIGGSFDGSHLTLRFATWTLNSEGTAAYPSVYSYDATVSPSDTELTGVIKDPKESWPLNCKRLTWQVKTPKPAPPTPVDGDWAGFEDWGNNKVQKIFHISNTEDGLRAYLDVPHEQIKGALAHTVSYDAATRNISISFGATVYSGKMTADGMALDITMVEPHFHYVIRFERLTAKQMVTK
ncbi:MAG: hypothetical protein P4L26_16955 [Terracidiphilus sp.]|nr:hypothetical protein [Terracidiphilus sp.]